MLNRRSLFNYQDYRKWRKRDWSFSFTLERYCPVSTGKLSRENEKNYTCLILPRAFNNKVAIFPVMCTTKSRFPFNLFLKVFVYLFGCVWCCVKQDLSLWHADSLAVAHRLRCPITCGILVHGSGVKPALQGGLHYITRRILNHWTTTEDPAPFNLILSSNGE